MSEIDWTAVLVALVGGGGTLTAIAGMWAQHKKHSAGKSAEDKAVASTPTPAAASSKSHDVEAIRLAQQAMSQVSALSDKLGKTETRLVEVERELGMFRRSYRSLYWWAQGVLYEWDSLRDNPDPPPLPPDIHHPD